MNNDGMRNAVTRGWPELVDLRRVTGNGPARLLRTLVHRGLTPEALPAAAALIRMLDKEKTP